MTAPARSCEGRGWTRVGEDRLAYDGWIRVVQRTLRLADGREVVWDLLDTPASVAVLPLTPEGRVICVRQFRPGPDRIVLSLPGGLVDDGEDVAAAAARELREETGYACASVEVIASVTPNTAIQPRHAAVAKGCILAHDQQLDEYEECEAVLVEVRDLRDQLRAGRMAATEQTYLALDHLGLL